MRRRPHTVEIALASFAFTAVGLYVAAHTKGQRPSLTTTSAALHV